MPELKLATFNCEWMVSIFGAGKWEEWDGEIPETFPGKQMGPIKLAAINDVPGLCRRIAGVIREVDPDIIGIQEGPPIKAQMELFVERFLANDYATHQSNRKSQSIYALVRRPLADRVALAPDEDAARLRSYAYYYPWICYKEKDRKKHKFDRVPLSLRLRTSSDRVLEILVVHTKSLFSKLKTKEQWEKREKAPVLDALDARQKLSAETAHLRDYIDFRLGSEAAPAGVVVAGDFNDGPFADQIEAEYLLHNIIDELRGSFLEPDKELVHAMDVQTLAGSWTVQFPDPMNDGKPRDILLDHVLVSPALVSGEGYFQLRRGSCVVETRAYDTYDESGGADDRGLRPSDHRPVSFRIDY